MKITGANVKVTRSGSKKAKTTTYTGLEKSPFPRLTDPTQKSALLKEFEPYFETFFASPQLSGCLATAVNVFFNDRKVYKHNQDDSIKDTVQNPDQVFLNKSSDHAKVAAGIGFFAPKLRITDNNVVLYTNPIELSFSITIPGPHDREAKAELQKYLTQLFPAFSVPTAWQYSPSESPPITFLSPTSNEITTGWKSFDFLKSCLKFDKDENHGYVPELDFRGLSDDLSHTSYASMFGIVSINSITSFDKFTIGAEGPTSSTGPIQVAISNAKVKVTVQSQIRVPLEMALWMTMQSRPENFNPKVFHEFASEHMANLNGLTKIKNIPHQTMTLKDIHTVNKARIQEYGLKEQPRTNEDGFMIGSNGKVLYVPTVNNTSTFDTIQKSAFDASTGNLIPNHKIKELINLPVYTDWTNEVFSFTGSEGVLRSERLSGGVALDSTTISKYLLRTPKDLFGVSDPNSAEYESFAAQTNENLFSILDTLSQDARKQGIEIIDLKAGVYSLVTLWNYISNIDATVANVFSEKFEGSQHEKNNVRAFLDSCRKLLSFIEVQTRYGISTLMEIRFWLVFFTKYATHPEKYIAEHNEKIAKNIPAAVDSLPESVEIPNLTTGMSVLPHQLQGVAQSRIGPELMIFDSAPGGGKTAQSIIDILIQKQEKRIGTAIVVCPPILVKEWCSEINKFSQGRVNAIPITAKVVGKLRKRAGVTREQFVQYCQSAPPNTIFVVSMRFLSLKRDKFNPQNKSSFEVRYGKNIIKQYPQVWLIRQLNPDYIVIDESHYAKSEKAQVTQVIKQISAFAKFKRLSSGTLVTNRGDDLIGQAAILNPAIYGNKESFYDKYAVTGGRSGQKFEKFKPGAEVRIRKDANAYTAWITKRRADWSFLLPKINTQFWSVDLTENQAKFYEDLINEAVEEIKKDKKLQKLLAEGDPDLADKIEEMMKVYLAKVEIFINCPDNEDLAFTSLSYINPDDLVSPKVKQAEKICRVHFEGGSLEDLSFQKEDSKVIIFGYHKAAIEHFRRHFNPGYKTVFYQTGDDDAILRFRQDPTVKILVAAETSLREGLNLQMASRLIRLETLWSPGAQEQAVSRVMRPDVGNQYNRKEINYDWFVTTGTLEIAKTCRLVSKVISNMTIMEGTSPEFAEFDRRYNNPDKPLNLIKMNLDTISTLNHFSDLPDYLDAWQGFLLYEQKQFESRKIDLRRMVAKKLGKPVGDISDEEARKYAFTPISSTTEIPGSKSIWVPLEPGTIPYDPFKLDLKPVAVLNQLEEDESEGEDEDDSDSEDDKDLIEQNSVEPGDMVYTEFGIGHIRQISKTSVSVDIPGLPFSPVRLSKALVFKPTHEENANKVAKLLKQQGSKGLTFMKGLDSIPTPTSSPNVKVVRTPKKEAEPIRSPKTRPSSIQDLYPETTKKEKDVRWEHLDLHDKLPGNTNQKYPIEVGSGIFDGYAGVYMFSDQKHLKKVLAHSPDVIWREYPQFVYRHVKTWQGLKNLITELESNFDLMPNTAELLMNAGKKLYHRGNPQLIQRTQQDLDVKTFLNVSTHKVSNNPSLIKVYPLIMNGQLYVIGSISNQSRQIQKFRRLNIKGVSNAQTHEPMHLALFRKSSNALRYLKKISVNFNAAGVEDSISTIKKTPQNFYRL
ncbi:MAG: DEAD/DEAH box helicase [Rhodospirillales bacterium]|nr:DEAD/DEAH box helicase [Rhodospirillales bacterium]